MGKFKVIEKVAVIMAYEYEVEAESKEDANDKYVNDLAGDIEYSNCYISSGKEGVY